MHKALTIPPPPQKTRKLSAEPAKQIRIDKPKMMMAAITIRGDAPYVQNQFSAKSRNKMIAAQEAGSSGKKGRKREARDFAENCKEATYFMKGGGHGIPAAGFRAAMIDACRMIGYRMTMAKMSVFVKADGFDISSGTPLVRITKGKPRMHLAHARNDNGSTDIRARPMWEPGWEAVVRVVWDADQFTASDVVNLMARVGVQVGIGEGRPYSKNSSGCGWGSFEIVNEGLRGGKHNKA